MSAARELALECLFIFHLSITVRSYLLFQPTRLEKTKFYFLDVPRIAQANSMSCWHASATMLWRYSQTKTGRQGPMHTLLEKYQDNTGIYPSDFIRLAKNVGLISVHDTSKSCTVYSPESLIPLLKLHGPIWCAGKWFGFGHVMVLRGGSFTSTSSTVHFNDPAGGVPQRGNIEWFNEKLSSESSGCLMVKDPTAY